MVTKKNFKVHFVKDVLNLNRSITKQIIITKAKKNWNIFLNGISLPVPNISPHICTSHSCYFQLTSRLVDSIGCPRPLLQVSKRLITKFRKT